MASMVETLREYLNAQREEMFEFKKAIKDTCREFKEELLLELALVEKGCVEGVLSAPHMEQLKQENEEDVMDSDSQMDNKESLEDREVEGRQDGYQLRSADTLLSKNYKTLIKVQSEGLDLFDLLKEDQYYFGNLDQFTINAFLNVRKYELRVISQKRLYVKGGEKALWEDIGNFKELVLKKGEEKNIQRICKGGKGLFDLMMVIGLIKYNFQFDSKD